MSISENMIQIEDFKKINKKEKDNKNISKEDKEDKEDYDEEEDDEEEYEDEEDDNNGYQSNENEESNDNEDNNINEDNKDNNGEITPLKKKRGRKSKPKDETQEVEKVQKKRGRKPKVKEVDENEKIPKKRGRKPKEKVYSVKELPKTFFEENKNETYILHLPIKLTDTDNINDPKPNIEDNGNYSLLDSNMGNEMDSFNSLFEQGNVRHSNNIISDNLVFDMDDMQDNNYSVAQQIQDSLLDNGTEMNNSDKNNKKEEDEGKNKIIKKNLRNIMYEFINSNNDKTWPDSTNTYCWWCCHPFN